MKRLFLTIMIGIGTLSMLAGNELTVNFSVNPPMSCSNCENKIKNNLRFEKGVKSVIPSAKKGIVTIKYEEGKTDVKKLEGAFKKIGYKATVVEAGQKTNKK